MTAVDYKALTLNEAEEIYRRCLVVEYWLNPGYHLTMQVNITPMIVMNDRVLSKLKDEYAEAIVENMTQRQAFSYLRQVIYNDVSVLGSEDVKRKIVQAFGEEKYQEMFEDDSNYTL